MPTLRRPLPPAAALVALVALVAACGGGASPVCLPACAPGYACQNGVCTANGTLDASAPDLAMGKCAPACAGGAPFCLGSNKCGACRGDADCPAGRICRSSADGTSACVPGCTDDSRCAAMGNVGQRCCGAACVDTRSDAANCGDCGKQCAAAHARATCVAGACQAGSCDEGWGDCNGDPKDGCETNLHTDPLHCGGCGTACQFDHAVAACASASEDPDGGAGGCYVAACRYGYDDCDGDPTNGCETSVLTDAKNCGACGSACKALANASVVCANQTCALDKCNAGYSDCDKVATNGCESNTGSDAKNCGACGYVCAAGLVCVAGLCTCPQCKIPNAAARCVNNACVLDHCNPGFLDCNNNVADGCEADLNNDAANCGGCGNVCPPQMPGCNMGTCAMGCLNGKMPPPACAAGKDPENASPWVICKADCMSAWVANANNNGGMYHALQICQQLGYSKIGQYGGTCGTVCGYCGNGACNALGNANFDNNGTCGSDQFGPILCSTVHWMCLR